ncbi:MAG: site-2 protease family protein [Sphingomonadales bacterium]|nr:site-2 protease family protein [Sphingomonadales bacterium]
MNDTLFQALALIVPMIMAIVFHEVAHGLTARALGDPTAAEMNRLSLNPLRHVDPFGTIVLPGLLALMKAPVFGWARPVPVNMRRLRNPRSGMMLVAIAGPATNLVMAGVGAVLLGLLGKDIGPEPVKGTLRAFLMLNAFNFVLLNVFLALFNLLPVPPFDGSHVVEGLLPRELALRYRGLRRYALPLMIGLLVVLPTISPQLDVVGRLVRPPVDWLTGEYLNLAAWVAGAG